MSCPILHCPHCGDRLIHQENRGINESASALGQHIHDKHPNTFWFMDIDAIVYKKFTQILRIFERKRVNGNLRASQQFLLPLLSIGIRILVSVGKLHKESGVFLVLTDPPFESATIQEIYPNMILKFSNPEQVNGNELVRFFTGEERKPKKETPLKVATAIPNR